MSIFTYHLLRSSPVSALRLLLAPPNTRRVPGLLHAECMLAMTLGSKIFSPARMRLDHMSVFARWDSEAAIDTFLMHTKAGQLLNQGWHVRMDFLRRWGHIDAFNDLPECAATVDAAEPVVAVTLARMKILQIPRFIRWGKPVEAFVRDNPGATLAAASIRLPRTVSTFSVWSSQAAMLDMVWGNDAEGQPERHISAMKERERKEFHHQFTTLRFKARSEHGIWDGRSQYIPGLNT